MAWLMKKREGAATKAHQSESYWATVWKRLKKSPSGMVGLFIVVLLVLVALTAPLLANNKPIIVSYEHNNETYIAFPAFTSYVQTWVPWEDMRTSIREIEWVSDEVEHTVQPGETLSEIAMEYFHNGGRTGDIVASNPHLIEDHPELFPAGFEVDGHDSPTEDQLEAYRPIREQLVVDSELLTEGEALVIPFISRPFSDHYPELEMQNMSWKDLRAYEGMDSDGDGTLESWDSNGDGEADRWDMKMNWSLWPVVEWDPMDFEYGEPKATPGECQVAHQIDDGITPKAGCGPCPSEEDLGGKTCRLTDGHLLGTDRDSRDVMARLIHGTVVAMLVGVISMSIAGTIGILLGLIAGFFGGWIDMLLSRITEVVMCFPRFFLIIAVIAFIKPSIVNIMMVIGLVGWTHIFRLVRGEVLRTRSLDYVAAAQAMGASSWRIMTRHVLPNSISPVFVALAFGIARAVLMETGLSFLGFGDPNVPSWGEIVMQGRSFISEGAWHLTILPGLAIFLTLTAFNLLGQGLRDAMDPKLRD
jgi:ABC-type dipeptide/oligopeptide/nickel transport system permease subunit